VSLAVDDGLYITLQDDKNFFVRMAVFVGTVARRTHYHEERSVCPVIAALEAGNLRSVV
jgi:hypothetical protein